ncbi:MAG: hypothetical protein Q4C61_09160 [Lachnospiraceae bacterium]|nr:hypothetical protein [Lachnospiraceae bacterium]
MSRGNDAIPTWSGFNYQGKVMLFYIVKLINKINKEQDKRRYSVNLEEVEDFCIIRDSEYVSFHQVKAWLSVTKWSSYSTAMDKLLKHRDESSNPTAKCYLMVAREVDDWDEDSNTYNGSIELYKHDSKIIGVCDVKDLIIQEIKKYLVEKGYNQNQYEIVYSELCLYLDDRIALMHKQGAKKRDYDIPFSEVLNIIEESVKKEFVRKEFYLKEKIYNYIMENMEKALDGICQDVCEESLKDCSGMCAARTAYEKIMEISDYTKFCKVLNPDKIDGWDNSLAMAENFPVKGLQNEIYYLLYQSKSPEKILGDRSSIYLQSKYSNAKNGQIIPTLLDLTSGYRGKSRALQRIFQNIIQNTDIMDILEGNSITVIPGSYNGFLSQAQITSGWKESNPEKINHYYREIELISSKELQEKFEENGGNHD